MKHEYNKLFDKITPKGSDDEFLEKILRKAENMEKSKRIINFKRPVIAVLAVIAALSLGVTSAAAAGIINFDNLFGGHLNLQNEELCEELLSPITNFTYTVTDDNYGVRLKGVTGTSKRVFGCFEIYCVSGQPVSEYSVKQEDKRRLNTECIARIEYNDNEPYSWGRYTDYKINDEGNIDVYFEIFVECEEGLQGQDICISLSNLYPNILLMKENDDVDFWIGSPVSATARFTYTASETALREKCIVDTDKEFTVDSEEYDGSDVKLKGIVKESSFLSGGAYLTVEYYAETSYGKNNYLNLLPFDLDIKLLKADGQEYDLDVEGTTTYVWPTPYENSKENIYSYDLVYKSTPDFYEPVNFIDVDEISAVSINGTVYTLE